MSTLSPYASEIANARLEALRTLIDALNEAKTPDEKRRCAVAIFNAPDPCELDDAIELEDEDEHENENDVEDADEHEAPEVNQPTTPVPPSIAALGVGLCHVATNASLPATTAPPTNDFPGPTSDIAHPTSPIAPSTSDIALPQPDSESSPTERRLRAREERQRAQMFRLAAQLAALPMPGS